jgi:hypothetical protein
LRLIFFTSRNVRELITIGECYHTTETLEISKQAGFSLFLAVGKQSHVK